MDYLLRFTLNNTTSGSLVIDEPDGWKGAMLRLERSEEFHSVVEHYDETFTFFDASYDYIVNIRDTQGFDADITFTVEISINDGTSYQTVFSGLIDLESSVQIDFYKIECPVVRNDLWARFINNRSTSVNVQSTTDLYGNNRIVLSPVTLNLSSQKTRVSYRGLNDQDITYALTASSPYGTIDFGTVEKDEIDEKFNYPRVISTTRPFELFAAEYAGSYAFDSEIYLSDAVGGFGGGNNQVSNIEIYIQKNDDAATAFTKTNQGTNGVDGRTRFSYTGTLSLIAGDFIYIYIQNTSGGNNTVVWLDFYVSYLDVDADTVFDNSTTQAMMIHEAFQSVIDRIVGADNMLYSEYLGAEDTQQTDYVSNGCASLCAVMRGVHLKTYSFTDKPFYVSFDQLWGGHNPIFNLGLGYETVDSVEVIRIEDKAHFYDSTVSLNLDYVNNIEVTIDTEKVFKNIKIGYQKWESESLSGIDDPQTKHEYAVQLKKSGTDIELYSNFVAASLAIEYTRRQQVQLSKDWKLDNDIFIIAIDKDIIGSPSLVYAPELDEPFSAITGLNNSDARYNLRLTPGRNFVRWRNYFNTGLQLYTSYDYKFVSGEGNVDMSSTVGTDSCISGTIVEDQNFDVTGTALHDNVVYSFDHPLSWTEYKTIRDSRHKAIGISQTNSGHLPFFIKSLEYNIHDAIGRFNLVKSTELIFDLSTWTNLSVSSGANWTTGVNPSVSITGIGDFTEYLGQSFVTTSGETYEFEYDFDSTQSGAMFGYFIYLLDSSLNVVGTGSITPTGAGNYTGSVSIVPSSNGSYIAFRAQTNDAGTTTIDINSVTYAL